MELIYQRFIWDIKEKLSAEIVIQTEGRTVS